MCTDNDKPQHFIFNYFLRQCIAREKNGQVSFPGRIVVHDRSRVESEILPRYFNHASFASLRRQLNYFAFCRVGKGKQKGATYCNENVIEINDILRLKRRAVGSTIPVVQKKKNEEVTKEATRKNNDETYPIVTTFSSQVISRGYSSSLGLSSSSTSSSGSKPTKSAKPSKKRGIISEKSSQIPDCILPVVHLPQRKKGKTNFALSNFTTTTIKESVDQMKMSFAASPRADVSDYMKQDVTQSSSFPNHVQLVSSSTLSEFGNEEDILAGCSALLALGGQCSL